MLVREIFLTIRGGKSYSLGYVDSEEDMKHITSLLNAVLPLENGFYHYVETYSSTLSEILHEVAAITNIAVKVNE